HVWTPSTGSSSATSTSARIPGQDRPRPGGAEGRGGWYGAGPPPAGGPAEYAGVGRSGGRRSTPGARGPVDVGEPGGGTASGPAHPAAVGAHRRVALPSIPVRFPDRTGCAQTSHDHAGTATPEPARPTGRVCGCPYH